MYCIKYLCFVFRRVGKYLKRGSLPDYLFGRILIDLLFYPSDIQKVYEKNKEIFGFNPNLFFPKTFSDKLHQRKLLYRKNYYTRIADKIAVREIIKEKIGDQYLNEIYWVGVDLLEAKQIKLPKKFVIKSNHSCGDVIIVADRDILDWEDASRQCELWLERDVSLYCGEWQYRWIKPCLLIEKFITDDSGNVPVDYKAFCFHGRLEYVQIDYGRFEQHTRATVDRDFKRLPFMLDDRFPPYPGVISKPQNFDKLIELSDLLSKGESFLRVDFYDVGYLVFGELTLHPGSGLSRFDPYSWDTTFGDLL